jgi:hypothetical protein
MNLYKQEPSPCILGVNDTVASFWYATPRKTWQRWVRMMGHQGSLLAPVPLSSESKQTECWTRAMLHKTSASVDRRNREQMLFDIMYCKIYLMPVIHSHFTIFIHAMPKYKWELHSPLDHILPSYSTCLKASIWHSPHVFSISKHSSTLLQQSHTCTYPARLTHWPKASLPGSVRKDRGKRHTWSNLLANLDDSSWIFTTNSQALPASRSVVPCPLLLP